MYVEVKPGNLKRRDHLGDQGIWINNFITGLKDRGHKV